MKRIVYLTFYYKPDLCAGSFRNSPLIVELAAQAKLMDVYIDVYTTLPNRYSTFDVTAAKYEEFDNVRVYRISLPPHKSGFLDQVFCFLNFYKEVIKLNGQQKAAMVFASSSRLFTAYLGYILAKKIKAPLYLDIRDIFVDTMNDVIKSKIVKQMLLPFLKIIERKIFNYAIHINLVSHGFEGYFKRFKKTRYSFFTNGIDEEFVNFNQNTPTKNTIKGKKTIVYAGNIGEGQGLHRIIPEAAKLLENDFQFIIIGDGGAKKQLKYEIERLRVVNVILKNPINRNELQSVYDNADYLFIHLNDYSAFKKVLPSKIFELATINKPILAGVSGYSAQFIKSEISESFVFEPCDTNAFVGYLKNDDNIGDNINRTDFVQKYSRKKINKAMAKSMLSYL